MSKRKNESKIQAFIITVAIMAVSFLLERYIPARILVYLALIGALSPFVFYLIWQTHNKGGFLKDAPKAMMTCFFGCVAGCIIGFMYLTVSAFRCHLVGNGFLHMLLFSAIIGLLPGGYFAHKAWLSLRKNQQKLHTRIITSIAILLLCVFGVLACSVNLNYALDFRTPEQCYTVIEDKDRDNHRKGPDSYEFKVSIEKETFYLEVSYDEYARYAIGDPYIVYKFQGAFGQSFYRFQP